MKLPAIIRSVFVGNLIESYNGKRFINVLRDFRAFGRAQALKPIFHQLCHSDEMQRVVDPATTDDQRRFLLQQIGNKLCQQFGFRTDLVDYALRSMAYGMQLTDDISQINLPTDFNDADFDLANHQSKQPTDFITLTAATFRLRVKAQRHYSLIDTCLNRPLIDRIEINNISPSENLSRTKVIISSPDPVWGEPLTLDLGNIAAGEQIDQDLDFSLNPIMLAQTAATTLPVSVCVQIDGNKLPPCLIQVSIQPAGVWRGIGNAPVELAAFVQPHHPEVTAIVDHAKSREPQSFTGYAARNADVVKRQIEILYEAFLSLGLSDSAVISNYDNSEVAVSSIDQIFSRRSANSLERALLLTAILERANLHPLLILRRNTAFVACWITRGYAPDPASDDTSFVALHASPGYDEILAIDTGQTSFNQAIANGQAMIARPDLNLLYIEMVQARRVPVAPLPILTQSDGEPQLLYAGQTQTTLLDPTQIQPEAIEPQNVTKITIWERKLLDLSLRNNLLNTRITSKTLQLLAVDIALLEDMLAANAEFVIGPRPLNCKPATPVNGLYSPLDQSDPIHADMLSDMKSGQLHAYLEDDKLTSALTGLYRASRLSLEENGANTLYLAIGMLRWFEDSQSQRPRYAPLLLMPVEIVRRVGSSYIIRSRDEDTVLNITLVEMLRQFYGINIGGLDTLPEDNSGHDVQRILGTVQRFISSQPRWQVENTVVLGIFSFNKFVLWNDLHSNINTFMANPLVSSFVTGINAVDPVEITPPDMLDTSIDERDVLLPISGDSSQIEAILAATAPSSFVLHGPPGTGKSQTITNIIANALSRGMKVLFVAEKMAALEVVQRRLAEIGLDPFCLELHSNKAKKAAVLDQLRLTCETIRRQHPADFNDVADQITAKQDKLNSHFELLHHKQPVGLSLYECIADYLSMESTPDFNLPEELLRNISHTQLVDITELMQQLSVIAANQQRLTDNPFNGCHITNINPALRSDIQSNAQQLLEQLCIFRTNSEKLQQILQIRVPANIQAQNQLKKVAVTIRDAGTLLLPMVLRSTAQASNFNALSELIADSNRMNRDKERVCSIFGQNFLTAKPDEIRVIWQRLLSLLQLSAATDITNPQPTEHTPHLFNQTYQATITLENAIRRVLEFFRAPAMQISAARLQALRNIADTLRATTAFLPGLLASPDNSDFLLEYANRYIIHKEQQEQLMSQFKPELLSLNVNDTQQTFNANNDQWFLARWWNNRKLFKQLSEYSLEQPVDKTNISSLLSLWQTIDDHAGFLRDNADRARSLMGITLYNNGEIQAEHVRQIIEQIKNLRNAVATLFNNPKEFAAACQAIENAANGDISVLHANTDTMMADLLNASEAALRAGTQMCQTGLDIPEVILQLKEYQELLSKINNNQTCQQLLPHLSPLSDADLSELRQAVDNTKAVIESFAFLDAYAKPDTLGHALADYVDHQPAQTETIVTVAAGTEYISRVFAELCSVLQADSAIAATGDFDTLQTIAEGWHDNTHLLRDWTALNNITAQLSTHNLGHMTGQLLCGKVKPEQVKNTFLRNFYKAYAEFIISRSNALSMFQGTLQSTHISNFQSLCRRFEQITRWEIFARISAHMPDLQSEAAATSEVNQLQRYIRNGGRGVSLRKIFASLPDLLPRICPCMLMSPISVAQYLQPDKQIFDLVVFDEASQIPTCEAIGVIGRAKHTIIVGDPKQMPPTNFFSVNTTDEEHYDIDDLESLLDDSLAINIPSHYLLWHYRSRHESLIAFSNANFYESRLMTFPSVDNEATRVSLIPVQGTYERGSTRNNRAEAVAIVNEIKTRLENPEQRHQSIGVVTFNTQQQSLIEDLLEDMLLVNPHLEPYAIQTQEPIFIKNLENVQGDERDVILFSVGYGPDRAGNITMNFGPLNRTGGERRLNVAVSRARYEMKVFSTLSPDQIDLNRTDAKGVKLLRAFLEYAQRHGRIQQHEVTQTHTDKLIDVIAARLRQNGFDVHTHVGSSDFHVDLAIVDNDNPTAYALGIILDGIDSRKAHTARDRDMVQPLVLNSLGWKIFHLWTLDWLNDPDRQIRDIEQAVSQPIEKLKPFTIAPPPPLQRGQSSSNGNQPSSENFRNYTTQSLTLQATTFDIIEGRADKELADTLCQIIAVEAPISLNIIFLRVAEAIGMDRIFPRVRQYIIIQLNKLCDSRKIFCQSYPTGQFYYATEQQQTSITSFRDVADRSIVDIAPQELAAAMIDVLHRQGSLTQADLIRQTAHIYGTNRVTRRIYDFLQQAQEYAEKNQYICTDGDRLRLNKR